MYVIYLFIFETQFIEFSWYHNISDFNKIGYSTTPHRSQFGQAAVLECGFKEMCHPPYSPDLTPSNLPSATKFKVTAPLTEIFN